VPDLERDGEALFAIGDLDADRACTCRRCGYQWTSRKNVGVPAQCPSCHRRDWSDYRVFQCRFCEATVETNDLWTNAHRVHPRCTTCGSRSWIPPRWGKVLVQSLFLTVALLAIRNAYSEWFAHTPVPVKAPRTDNSEDLDIATTCFVRSGPSIEADAITKVAKGQRVTLLESRGNWRRISNPSGAAGWIHASCAGVKASR
jgi:hypothetical protein